VDLADDLADAVADIYREAETALLRIIARRLNRNLDAPDWAMRRLADVQLVRRSAAAVVAGLEVTGTEAVRRAVITAYDSGNAAAVADLADFFADLLGRGQTGANRQTRELARQAGQEQPSRSLAVQALANALVAEARQAHQAILPTTLSIYRQAIAGATARHLAGGIDRRTAAQSAWQALADRGITCYIDGRGRRWSLASYVEMATRTAASRAIAQGVVDANKAQGNDLLYVIDRPGECRLCRPWEHKIISIDGPAGPRQVLSQASRRWGTVQVAATLEQVMAAGLFHPNCRHELATYVHGRTNLRRQGTADEVGNYARSRQREIERYLRKWKTREATALTPAARVEAQRKQRFWEETLEELLADYELPRYRYREEIGVGHIPPPTRADDPAALLGPSHAPPAAAPAAPSGLGPLEDKVTITGNDRATVLEALRHQQGLVPFTVDTLREVAYLTPDDLHGLGDPNILGQYDPKRQRIVLHERIFDPGFPARRRHLTEVRWLAPCGHEHENASSIVAHEFGHHVDHQMQTASRRALKRFWQLVADELGVEPPDEPDDPGIEFWCEEHEDVIREKISEYASTRGGEVLAEIWQEYSTMGENARPWVRAIGEAMLELAETEAL
jgi:hypothetical protein